MEQRRAGVQERENDNRRRNQPVQIANGMLLGLGEGVGLGNGE